MINNVVLVGRLTKDIELKKTSSNISTCTFTLACNRRYGDKDAADFISCVAWRQSADYLSRYASKGDIVGVEGRITTRNYDGQYGKVYVTEVTCDSVQLIGHSQNANASYAKSKSEIVNSELSQDVSIDDVFQPTLGGELSNQEEHVIDIGEGDLPF